MNTWLNLSLRWLPALGHQWVKNIHGVEIILPNIFFITYIYHQFIIPNNCWSHSISRYIAHWSETIRWQRSRSTLAQVMASCLTEARCKLSHHISACLWLNTWSCWWCNTINRAGTVLTKKYCKISNIRCTKSQNLYASRLGLQLSLCNILKPGVKTIMKM